MMMQIILDSHHPIVCNLCILYIDNLKHIVYVIISGEIIYELLLNYYNIVLKLATMTLSFDACQLLD